MALVLYKQPMLMRKRNSDGFLLKAAIKIALLAATSKAIMRQVKLE